MENFIHFKTFMYQADTLVIKTLFESENIRFYFKNDTAIATHPFASLAIGGIELFVHKDDEERTQKLYEKLEL